MKSLVINALIGFVMLSALFGRDALGQSNPEREASTASSPKGNGTLTDRITVGGNFGVNFGNVDFIDISPRFGYRVNDQWTAGLGAIFRYRNDKRLTPHLETKDYGGSLFSTYRIFDPFFLMVEYEALRYQVFRLPDLGKERRDFNSFLAGGGMGQPLGGKGSINVMILYNFSYTSTNPGPYDSPWIIRGGVGINL